MAALFSSLFKQRKPKQFGFKTVYYNAEKEAREQRIKEITSETLTQTGSSENCCAKNGEKIMFY